MIAQERRYHTGGLFLALHDGEGVRKTSHWYSRATQKRHREGVGIRFNIALEVKALDSGRH